jgi:hypothetical protein
MKKNKECMSMKYIKKDIKKIIKYINNKMKLLKNIKKCSINNIKKTLILCNKIEYYRNNYMIRIYIFM